MKIISQLNRILHLVATSSATKEEYELISFEINDLKKSFDLKNINLNVQQVIESVKLYYNLPDDYYIIKSRKREFIIARQMCAKILVDNTNMSLSEIGKYFGKDHSTIIHSKKAIEDQIDTNRTIQIQYNELLSVIKKQLIIDK